MSDGDAVLAVIAAIAERGGEADDVLRDALAALGGVCPYAAIAFVEGGELVVGPEVGEPGGAESAVPVEFGGVRVAELRVGGAGADADGVAFVRRVAETLAPYCLVGWDTGGERWDP